MPRLLDPDLKRVAQHRQVSIKTARDWRDSDNRKWHDALSEICSRNAIEVEASPVPFGRLAETATTATKASHPLPSDPFAGLELIDPFEGTDPLDGFGLSEIKL